MDPKLTALREQLPSVQGLAYFNTGTAGPIPVKVHEATAAAFQYQFEVHRADKGHFERMMAVAAETRPLLAGLLGCRPDEVALTQNTTAGMNMATLGINWQPGDEAITTNVEHPGALLPLYVVRDRFGVTIKVANLLDRPGDALETISKLITGRTRLISISHVAFTSGMVLPVAELCAMARQRGVPVLIDGAQSFGAMPVDMKQIGCDYYAVPGQKWVCGPEGTGALYVSETAISQTQLMITGFYSVDGYNTYGGILPKNNAHRFEAGLIQPALVAGQKASAQWFHDDVGPDWAYERIRTLATAGYAALAAIPGVTVLTPPPPAGLITFQIQGVTAAAAVAALAQSGFLTRWVPWPGGDAIRISTGFYNTEDEVNGLAAAVGELAQG